DPEVESEAAPSEEEGPADEFSQALLERERPVRTPPSDVKVAAAAVEACESDAHLGDVDLVDHLMRSNDPLTPLAVRLIRARGGPASIRWSPNDNLVPWAEARAAVRAGGRQFGVLHAPEPVTDAELGPWAGWLGHWLALEDRLRTLHRAAMTDPLTG